jgi:hypothetical protein
MPTRLGLDDCGVRVRSPEGARDIISSGQKRPELEVNKSPPFNVKINNILGYRLYLHHSMNFYCVMLDQLQGETGL